MSGVRQLTENEASSVKQLREMDLSYCAIAKQTGIYRQYVAHYCHENGLAKAVHPNVIAANQRTGARRVERSIEKYSGYICRYCGKTYTLNRNRWGAGDGEVYCSQECFRLYRAENKKGKSCNVYFPICEICKERFTSRLNKRYCSRDCELEYGRVTERTRCADNHVVVNFICEECGKLFFVEYPSKRKKFCSSKCGEEANKKSLAYKEARKRSKKLYKARKRGAKEGEIFNDKEIFLRDGWICGICRKRVKQGKVVPHPLAPTIDHIIALADGGSHTKANVQCAHFECNWKKGAGLSKGGDQLRLFG